MEFEQIVALKGLVVSRWSSSLNTNHSKESSKQVYCIFSPDANWYRVTRINEKTFNNQLHHTLQCFSLRTGNDNVIGPVPINFSCTVRDEDGLYNSSSANFIKFKVLLRGDTHVTSTLRRGGENEMLSDVGGGR